MAQRDWAGLAAKETAQLGFTWRRSGTQFAREELVGLPPVPSPATRGRTENPEDGCYEEVQEPQACKEVRCKRCRLSKIPCGRQASPFLALRDTDAAPALPAEHLHPAPEHTTPTESEVKLGPLDHHHYLEYRWQCGEQGRQGDWREIRQAAGWSGQLTRAHCRRGGGCTSPPFP